MRKESKDFLVLSDFIEESQNNSPLNFSFDLEKLNVKIFEITKNEFEILEEKFEKTMDKLNDSLASGSLFEDMGWFSYSLDKIEFDENTYILRIDYFANDCKEPSIFLRFRLN